MAVLATVLAALGILIAQDGLRAQSSESVAPPQPAAPAAVGAPTPLVPFDPGTRREDGSDGTFAAPQVQGIEIDRLGERNPDSIGVLDAGRGGFGPTMWLGSDRAVVEGLLLRLQARMTSTALRDLARRLLLSSAPPPGAGRGAGAPVEPSADLLALRIDRLIALGEVEGLNRLLQAVPRRFDDERILRGRVEGLVMAGDLEGACREVRNGVGLHHALPYWQRGLVLCQMTAGERDQAELGLALMRERGTPEDPGFQALVEVLRGGDAEVPTATAMAPLNFAALQSVGWQPPAELVNRGSPGLLAAIAKSPQVPPEERAVAAELAIAMGALAPEVLAELYGGFEFEPGELDGSREGAAAITGPRQRALLVRRVAASGDLQSRAHRTRVALETAAQTGLYRPVLLVLLPEIDEFPLEPGLAWFAETASRAYFAAGRFEKAGAWYALARQQVSRNSLAVTATVRLWPYLRLSGGPTLDEGGSLATWRELRRGTDEAVLARGEALLRAALQALGEGGSPPLRTLAAAASTGTDSGLLVDLQEASESRRSGETVLLTLVILGEAGLEAVSPTTLNSALAALLRIGLELEARRLAIEAAIANGV